jgi:hypothetical protein
VRVFDTAVLPAATQRADVDAWLGREPINSEWSADVRFSAHFELKSAITVLPKSADFGLMHRISGTLLNHLVGAREQRRGHFQAKRHRRNQVDDQFELDRLLHRQISRLRPA